MFSKESDLWTTPLDLFLELDREFGFSCDAAATRDTALVENYRGPDHIYPEYRNGLVFDWGVVTFCNPPYSKCRQFIAKAAEEAKKGCTVVCLVPSRTDTMWWHTYVWDRTTNTPRPGVEVRFIQGRLKFGDQKNSAPFPSVVVIFRPAKIASV